MSKQSRPLIQKTRRVQRKPSHSTRGTMGKAPSSWWGAFNRLPIPTLGVWTPLVGLVGLVSVAIACSLIIALPIRAARVREQNRLFAADSDLPTVAPNATPNPEFLAPTLPAWAGTDRVSVLLLGADSRPDERGVYRPRTDTIMLLMLDPNRKVASVLSVPRDLYLEIPGYGLNRVNTAYVWGGGPLAVDTIQYNLGIRIDYYMLVEFDAFIRFVDEIGGIDIYVPETINDPWYPDHFYGYDPFYLNSGQQHLDGPTALKYARTRHGDNDYERARRQQDVLFAIRDKVFSLNMMPTLVQKAPTFFSTISDSIVTDMTLDQMLQLGVAAQDVAESNIRSGVIDANYVVGYYTPEGASVLIPNRYAIGPFLNYIFWLDE